MKRSQHGIIREIIHNHHVPSWLLPSPTPMDYSRIISSQDDMHPTCFSQNPLLIIDVDPPGRVDLKFL